MMKGKNFVENVEPFFWLSMTPLPERKKQE
jgi:hypothetical protein